MGSVFMLRCTNSAGGVQKSSVACCSSRCGNSICTTCTMTKTSCVFLWLGEKKKKAFIVWHWWFHQSTKSSQLNKCKVLITKPGPNMWRSQSQTDASYHIWNSFTLERLTQCSIMHYMCTSCLYKSLHLHRPITVSTEQWLIIWVCHSQHLSSRSV